MCPHPSIASGVILWCLVEQIFENSSEDTLSFPTFPSVTRHQGRGRIPFSAAFGFSEEPVLGKVFIWVSWICLVFNLGSSGCLSAFTMVAGINREGGGVG